MSRILITSALPYINGIKHLGTLAGSMLPADVYARFQRSRGRETLYICATDEHGTPTELAAAEAGQDPATFCAEQHEVQHDLGRKFGLSWDHFGRSSSPQNHKLTQRFAQQLWEAGFIEERVTQQVYSNADKRFLPDRYVIGTCPHCGYEAARGDQCENCTRVLDPADLIHPRSAVSGSTDIEIRDSKHLFLRQSLFSDKLRAWIEARSARLAAAGHLDRAEVAGRGPAGPRHHPRPGVGRAGQRLRMGPEPGRRDAGHRGPGGQGVLRLVRRAHRIHRRHLGMGRRPGRRRPAGSRRGRRVGALVARARRRRRHLCGVHGQGQRALPHRGLPLHPDRA